MSTDELTRAFADPDAELRRRAVLQTRTASGQGLGALLMQALGDVDWRVRKEAVEVLCERALSLSLVDGLIQAMCQGENIGLRNAALDVLQRLGPAVEGPLVAALPHVPEPARKFVIEALGDAGSALAIPELSRAAAAADVNVASEAIEALARVGGVAAENAIRAQLSNPSPFLRVAALDALNRREAVLSWEELAPLLSEPTLRRVALSALGRTGRAEALAPLFLALEEAATSVVTAAAVAIASLPRHAPALGEEVTARTQALPERTRVALRLLLTSNAETDAKRAAVELLVRAQDVGALHAVVEHLAEDAPAPETARALGAWGAAAIAPLVALSRTHSSPHARGTALELAADLSLLADGGRFRPEVQRALLEGLSDPEAPVQDAACRSLAEGGSPDDARSLVAHLATASGAAGGRAPLRALARLAERHPTAVESALADGRLHGADGVALASVLATLTGSLALERLQVLLTAGDPNVRRAAVQALGKVGGERAQSLVPIALADENPDVQVAAANVLGKLRGAGGEACGVEDLLLSLSSPFPQVRAAAARALGHTGASLAREPLCALLSEADTGLAMAAVAALGALGVGDLGQSLGPALAHRDAEVVKAALRALADAADASAGEALTAAVTHPAWNVRKLAAELLPRVCGRSALPLLRRRLLEEPDDLVRAALSAAMVAAEGEG